MATQYSGRGSWFRTYLLDRYGKRAVQELDEHRVRQGVMPPCDDDIVYKGPEFDFNFSAATQPHRSA